MITPGVYYAHDIGLIDKGCWNDHWNLGDAVVGCENLGDGVVWCV